jgi:hypothetical protein
MTEITLFQPPKTPALTRTIGSILQRQACETCEQKRKSGDIALQRFPTARGESKAQGRTPIIVDEVLNTSGQPLDAFTRGVLEPRFGHDFSRVRVHTDSRAAESALQVNALAYTVGQHIIFGSGQYGPASQSGKRLLAHELAHVVQQSGQSQKLGQELRIDRPDSRQEAEAERLSGSLAAQESLSSAGFDKLSHAFQSPKNLPSSRPNVSPLIQRVDPAAATTDPFPGFTQGDYVTCGAASLVSALMIWDKQKRDPNAPNQLVVDACNLALSYWFQQRSYLIETWNEKNADGEALFEQLNTRMISIRNAARLPGSKLTEEDFQVIGLVFYSLYQDASAGLSKEEILALTEMFGMTSVASDEAVSFEEIFSTPTLTGLKPGQIAQIQWWVKTGADADGNPTLGKHAFLIGRFKDGKWFLSDQGNRPPTELQASDLASLKDMISEASAAGTNRFYTGGQAKSGILIQAPRYTGVVLLGDPSGLESKAEESIIKPGEVLGELDVSMILPGDTLKAGEFLERQYSFDEVKTALSKYGTGNSGLIVEMPEGVFNLYKTNLVQERNLAAENLDESAGGALVGKQRFPHAWLLPCATSGCKDQWMQVY